MKKKKEKKNSTLKIIISVASLKLPTAIVCMANFRHFAKIIIFPKKNILLQILGFKNRIAKKRISPKIARTAYNMKGRLNVFDFSYFECRQIF